MAHLIEEDAAEQVDKIKKTISVDYPTHKIIDWLRLLTPNAVIKIGDNTDHSYSSSSSSSGPPSYVSGFTISQFYGIKYLGLRGSSSSMSSGGISGREEFVLYEDIASRGWVYTLLELLHGYPSDPYSWIIAFRTFMTKEVPFLQGMKELYELMTKLQDELDRFCHV